MNHQIPNDGWREEMEMPSAFPALPNWSAHWEITREEDSIFPPCLRITIAHQILQEINTLLTILPQMPELISRMWITMEVENPILLVCLKDFGFLSA